MRRPTAGDVADCLMLWGCDMAMADDVALRLVELCDRCGTESSWQYLDEILKRMTTAPANEQDRETDFNSKVLTR